MAIGDKIYLSKTDEEIKTIYENNDDTNPYTDADQETITKLPENYAPLEGDVANDFNTKNLTVAGDLEVVGTINDRDIVADGEKIDKMGDWDYYTPADSSFLRLMSPNGKMAMYTRDDEGTYLYANGVYKFNTNSGGAKVTGDLEVTENIGIGIDPTEKFHLESGTLLLSSATAINPQIRINKGAVQGVQLFTNDNGGYARFYDASNSVKVLIQPTGYCYFNNGSNVGIGLTAPKEKLHVLGGTRLEGDLEVTEHLKTKSLEITDGVDTSFLENDVVSVQHPKGARIKTSGDVGSLGIRLPAGAYGMVSFDVNIYIHTSNKNVTIKVAGYAYSGGWSETSVQVLSGTSTDYTVRFCKSSTHWIMIGDTNHSWGHTNAVVSNFKTHFMNIDPNIWKEKWEMGFLTSYIAVYKTHTNNLPYSDYNKMSNKPTLPSAGGRNDQNFACKNITPYGRIISPHNSLNYLTFINNTTSPIGLCIANMYKQTWFSEGSKIHGNLEITGDYKTTRGTGANNIALGTSVLNKNTSGLQNVGTGDFTLENNATGSYNTGVGHKTLNLNVSGTHNTAVGSYALQIARGTRNIGIGYNAQSPTTTTNHSATIGDNSITNLRCNDNTISTLSDARDKTSIIDCEYGLDYINALRPVSFTWDYRKEHEVDGEMPTRQGERSVGFIAQEMKEVQDANDASELNTYQHYPAELNEDGTPMDGMLGVDLMEADYGKLLPVAIQAIKELSAKVDELEKKLSKGV